MSNKERFHINFNKFNYEALKLAVNENDEYSKVTKSGDYFKIYPSIDMSTSQSKKYVENIVHKFHLKYKGAIMNKKYNTVKYIELSFK